MAVQLAILAILQAGRRSDSVFLAKPNCSQNHFLIIVGHAAWAFYAKFHPMLSVP